MVASAIHGTSENTWRFIMKRSDIGSFMRADMTQAIEAKRSFKIAPALALTLLAALALGGCQSPMYSGTPEDMSYAVAPTYSPGNPAYIGRNENAGCLLYTSPSPRDGLLSRMPSSA